VLELRERDAKISKTEAETGQTQTAAMKDVSDISSAEKGDYMARAKLVFDTLKTQLDAEQQKDQMELAAGGQGRVPGMEGQPGNAMGAPAPQGPAGGVGIGPEGSPLPIPAVPAGGVGGAASIGGP
jgi:hypothetical protein